MKYGRYPAYRASGVEWLDDVPEHWDVRRLKYVASTNDEALPEDTDPTLELTYVDIGSIDPVKGVVDYEKVVFEDAPSRARRIARYGDTIISTVRTYLQAIAPIREAPPNLVVSTGFAVVRPRQLEPRFAGYALREQGFVKAIVAISVGVSYPAANASDIACLPVPFPPPAEQFAIANFLDRETAKIDALVEKKRLLIERLEEQRAALISRVVTRGLPPEAARAAGLDPLPRLKASGVEWLGDVPEHWEVTRLSRLVDCLDGARIPLNAEERGDRQGDYPYWGANGILDHLDSWLFDEPLVLLGEDGAPFFAPNKRVAFFVQGKIWVNNHAHVLRPRNGLLPGFLAYALNQTDYGAFIDGSTRDKLTQQDMNKIPVALPSAKEQEAIVSWLDEETDRTGGLTFAIETAIERLQEYRAALITTAVTGKIDVRGEAAPVGAYPK